MIECLIIVINECYNWKATKYIKCIEKYFRHICQFSKKYMVNQDEMKRHNISMQVIFLVDFSYESGFSKIVKINESCEKRSRG